MSIEVFLCVPAAIFSVGFLIFSILFMNPDKLKQAPFDIQIGKIILFLMIGTPFYKKLKTITNYK